MCNLEDVREDTRETWQHVNHEVRKFKPRETFMQFQERLGGSNPEMSSHGVKGHESTPFHGGHTEGNGQGGGENAIFSQGIAAAPVIDESATPTHESAQGNGQGGEEDDIRSQGMAAAPVVDESAPPTYQSAQGQGAATTGPRRDGGV